MNFQEIQERTDTRKQEVSQAAIIMISSLLKDSSDGLDACICTNDHKDHIQDTKSNHNL